MPRRIEQDERMDYDEFSMFAENAEEAGLSFGEPPAVRREFVAVDASGRRLSALVWGTARPQLVFLHGGGQNAHTWDTVLLALRRSAVAIDLPGHGHSDGPDPAAATVAGYATDVAAAVRKLCPGVRLVVGMSLGGMTAMLLSAVAPELVAALVLVDILPEPDPAAARSVMEFLDGPETFDDFDEILARTIRFNPTRSVSSLRRGILHNAVQLPDGRWQWRHRRHRGASVSNGRADSAELATCLWDSLAGLRAPLLLVRGLAAGSVVTDAQVARLQEVVPSARVEPVPGAGHSVQGDQPVVLARLIDEFAGPPAPPGVQED
jgi:pimeloyl-ACP methyl ester carboxylesterase